MTLSEMASAIRNHMNDGLSGAIGTFDYSLRQIEEEIILMRNDLIQKQYAAGKVDLNSLTQTLPNIEVTSRDLGKGFDTGIRNTCIRVPSVLLLPNNDGILFLGTLDRRVSIKVYTTESAADHKYCAFTKHKPYARLDTSKDGEYEFIDLFNLNGGLSGIKYLTMRYVLADPRVIAKYEDTPFPCSGEMQNAIITAISEKYIRYYRSLRIMPIGVAQTDVT